MIAVMGPAGDASPGHVRSGVGPDDLCVQFGCGLSAPSDWINFDASPTLRMQRLPLIGCFATRARTKFPANVSYGDVVRGLPIRSASCRAVFASHVLEHLSREDCLKALDESFRLLKRGGILRVVVPDLQRICSAYMDRASRCDAEASHQFMQDSYLGIEQRPRGMSGIIQCAFGNSKHLWMWDRASLSFAIESAGFRQVRVADFGDSIELAFKSVEDRDRFAGALALEAIRP